MAFARPSLEQLPLTFQRPPGWPGPSLDWVAGHQGWEPADGWVPLPGTPPAPRGWTFWMRNEPAYSSLVRRRTEPAKRLMLLGAALFVVGTLLTWQSFSTPTSGGGLSVIFWGAMVWGPIAMLRAGFVLRTADSTVMARTIADAPLTKATLDRAAYEEYLRSMVGS
jgi:hypothetical protein